MKIKYENPHQIKVTNSYYCRIYIAGDYNVCKQLCQQYCAEVGECVNIIKTSYVYTGGFEEGMCIEFINYPRFPREEIIILNRAFDLAKVLVQSLYQKSFTVTTPSETHYYSYLVE